MKIWARRALAVGALALTAPANAESVNLIKRTAKAEGNCFNSSNSNHLQTYDDNAASIWSVKVSKACHLIYRFDEPVVASQVLVLNALPKGVDENQLANRVSVWGSHQSFGNVFYKLGEAKLPATGAANIQFSNSLNLRSLKLIVEKTDKVKWSRLSSIRVASIADIALISPIDSQRTENWPAPRLSAFKGVNDPILLGKVTKCDELAGNLYSPDSYGYGRTDYDLGVPAALRACEIAVSKYPGSARLANNLARVELLGERSPRAIARLISPLLQNYAPAQYQLAQSFEKGTGVEKNAAQAEALYKKSAEQDFGPALLWLAEKAHKEKTIAIAADAKNSLSKDVEPYLKRAIEIGHLPASSQYFQDSLKKDLISVKDAYDLLERAAEAGSIVAMRGYSTNLHNGHKIGRREADSAHYGSILSRLNSHEEMTNISRGNYSSNWQYWRRRAAYSGNYYSLEHFAKWLQPSEKRTYLAKLAFAKALKRAKNGEDWPMEWIAQYYEAGFGVEKNQKEAKIWRCRARDAGNPVALSSGLPFVFEVGVPYNGGC